MPCICFFAIHIFFVFFCFNNHLYIHTINIIESQVFLVFKILSELISQLFEVTDQCAHK